MIYGLSEKDRDVIRQVVQDELHRPLRWALNRPGVVLEDPRPTEAYIAFTPVGGIPALVHVGTAPAEPGAALCDIYSVVDQDGVGELTDVAFQELVYNVSAGSVAGSVWVLVVRDKFGAWVVVPTSADKLHLINVNKGGTGGFNVTSGAGFTEWVADGPGVDTDGYWNAGLKRVIIPASLSGWYNVAFTGVWDSNATGTRRVKVTVNGFDTFWKYDAAAPTDVTVQSLNVNYPFNVGDAIRIYVSQDSGITLGFNNQLGGYGFLVMSRWPG